MCRFHQGESSFLFTPCGVALRFENIAEEVLLANNKKKILKKSGVEGIAPLKEQQTAMDLNIAPEI